MGSIYKEKSSGNLLEFDVQHADTQLVVFRREGGAREMMEASKFNDAFELISAEAPILPDAAATPTAAVARTKYREKSSGTVTGLDIREMDMNNVVFQRPGRALERLERKKFDELYEVLLPAANPTTIPSVAVVPQSRPDPNGPARAASPVPAPDVPDVIKAIRALGDRFQGVEDAVGETRAKVDAIYKIIGQPAPESAPETKPPTP